MKSTGLTTEDKLAYAPARSERRRYPPDLAGGREVRGASMARERIDAQEPTQLSFLFLGELKRTHSVRTSKASGGTDARVLSMPRGYAQTQATRRMGAVVLSGQS